MKSGLIPNKVDHRDYGHFQTFGAVMPPSLPQNYSTDAGLWMPSQDVQNVTPNFIVPPLPYGCTDYGTSDAGSDLIGSLLNPESVDDITNANANGGGQVRTALNAALSLGYFKAFFNVQPQNLDFFDSVRLASLSGVPEKRSIIVGSPWYSTFESVDSTGILNTPQDFTQIGSWHCWKISGWKLINDQVYLIGKSWQSAQYGDKGYCYFSRSLFNQLMSVNGSVAYSVTNAATPPPQTINTTILQWIMSNFRLLFGLSY